MLMEEAILFEQMELWQRLQPLLPQLKAPVTGPFWSPDILQPIFTMEMVRVLMSVEVKSDGYPWIHASMSLRRGRRMPDYNQLELVRKRFFHHDALVLQVFPPMDEFYALTKVAHLWSRVGGERVVPDLREEVKGILGV